MPLKRRVGLSSSRVPQVPTPKFHVGGVYTRWLDKHHRAAIRWCHGCISGYDIGAKTKYVECKSQFLWDSDFIKLVPKDFLVKRSYSVEYSVKSVDRSWFSTTIS